MNREQQLKEELVSRGLTVPGVELDMLMELFDAYSHKIAVESRVNEAEVILEFPPNTLTLFKKAIKARIKYLKRETPGENP